MTDAPEKFTCARYREGPPIGNGEHNWRVDNTCSFCGSLNPDELMRRLEIADIQVGPTDKAYKIYVRNLGGPQFKMHYRNCPPNSGCTYESCDHWVTVERDETKFYFQHLTEAQRTRFIEIHNEKRMNIGYPGYFYMMPYFARPA